MTSRAICVIAARLHERPVARLAGHCCPRPGRYRPSLRRGSARPRLRPLALVAWPRRRDSACMRPRRRVVARSPPAPPARDHGRLADVSENVWTIFQVITFFVSFGAIVVATGGDQSGWATLAFIPPGARSDSPPDRRSWGQFTGRGMPRPHKLFRLGWHSARRAWSSDAARGCWSSGGSSSRSRPSSTSLAFVIRPSILARELTDPSPDRWMSADAGSAGSCARGATSDPRARGRVA